MRLKDIKVGDVFHEVAGLGHNITSPIGIPNDNIYYTGSILFQLFELDGVFNYIKIDSLRIPPDKLVIKEIGSAGVGGGYDREGAYWSSTSPIYLIVPTREGLFDKFINWPNENPLEVKE